MTTKFETIEDTESVQDVLEGLNPKVKSHLRRSSFIGYLIIGVSEKLILEILRNKDLNGSLFYLDIDVDDGFKELTEEFMTNDMPFREANIRNFYVSNIYVATHEALKFLIEKLPRK